MDSGPTRWKAPGGCPSVKYETPGGLCPSSRGELELIGAFLELLPGLIQFGLREKVNIFWRKTIYIDHIYLFFIDNT